MLRQKLEIIKPVTHLVKQRHDGNCRSHTGAGGQEVEEQPEVPVVVVDVVEVPQDLRVRQPTALLSLFNIVLVRLHGSRQVAEAGEEEPEEVVEVAEDVEYGETHGDVQRVDVEAGGVSVTFIIEFMSLADDGLGVV